MLKKKKKSGSHDFKYHMVYYMQMYLYIENLSEWKREKEQFFFLIKHLYSAFSLLYIIVTFFKYKGA